MQGFLSAVMGAVAAFLAASFHGHDTAHTAFASVLIA